MSTYKIRTLTAVAVPPLTAEPFTEQDLVSHGIPVERLEALNELKEYARRNAVLDALPLMHREGWTFDSKEVEALGLDAPLSRTLWDYRETIMANATPEQRLMLADMAKNTMQQALQRPDGGGNDSDLLREHAVSLAELARLGTKYDHSDLRLKKDDPAFYEQLGTTPQEYNSLQRDINLGYAKANLNRINEMTAEHVQWDGHPLPWIINDTINRYESAARYELLSQHEGFPAPEPSREDIERVRDVLMAENGEKSIHGLELSRNIAAVNWIETVVKDLRTTGSSFNIAAQADYSESANNTAGHVLSALQIAGLKPDAQIFKDRGIAEDINRLVGIDENGNLYEKRQNPGLVEQTAEATQATVEFFKKLNPFN